MSNLNSAGLVVMVKQLSETKEFEEGVLSFLMDDAYCPPSFSYVQCMVWAMGFSAAAYYSHENGKGKNKYRFLNSIKQEIKEWVGTPKCVLCGDDIDSAGYATITVDGHEFKAHASCEEIGFDGGFDEE